MYPNLSENEWNALVNRAFEGLPVPHRDAVKNVAIVLQDDPTPDQRQEMQLLCNQTLLGLYTGVPLTQRQGRTDLPPDVITLFKNPLLVGCETEDDLYEHIRHTLWHEVAHYFGLNHTQIHNLE